MDKECEVWKRRCAKPEVAPLSKLRLGRQRRAFARCFVDYAGPFVTKMKRRVSTKRYLCLFTCPAIRAVHMDMAFSLSNTDSSMHLAKRWLPEENLEKLVVTMDQTLP